jgi:hypothetical protein
VVTVFLKTLTNLASLLVCASLILGFPAAAQEQTNPIREIAEGAGLHCQLWLHHINQKDESEPAAPDYVKIIEESRGGTGTSGDPTYLHEATLGGLPEFGFLTGPRWDFAKRAERRNFNYYFLKFLGVVYPFYPGLTGDYCSLDVSLTEKEPPPADENSFVELPAPRLFLARVTTTLPGKPTPIPITYYFEQELHGWFLVNIAIDKTSLQASYADSFATLLAKGGFPHLIAWLISQASPPKKRDTE